MPSELRPVVKAFGLRKIVLDGDRGARGHGGLGRRRRDEDGDGYRAGPACHRAIARLDRLSTTSWSSASPVGWVRVQSVTCYSPRSSSTRTRGASTRPHALPGVQPAGKLVTHDDFDMGPDEHARLVADGFIAVDMETAAIAAVCEARGCAWSAVRAISDLVGVTPGAVIDLADADGNPSSVRGCATWCATRSGVPDLLRLAARLDGSRDRGRPSRGGNHRCALSSVALLAFDGVHEVRRRGFDAGDGVADRVGPARDDVGDRASRASGSTPGARRLRR